VLWGTLARVGRLLMDFKVHKLEGELADTVHDDMDRAALGGGRTDWRCSAKYDHKQATCNYRQNGLRVAINHVGISG
jgi:hypothetical protein